MFFQKPNFLSGFTLIELLVVISIIALLLGILVPVLGVAKKNANQTKESVNLRNLVGGMSAFSSSSKDWFPGLDPSGKYAGASAAGPEDFFGRYYAAKTNALSLGSAVSAIDSCNNYAMAVLLEEGAVNAGQWYSPGETGQTSANAQDMAQVQANTTGAVIADTNAGTKGVVTHLGNSFSMLAYGSPSLKKEWKNNQNTQAILMGSRMIFSNTNANAFNSLWTDVGGGYFKGALVRGDTSTSMENFHAADVGTAFSLLRYGVQAGGVAAAPTVNVVGAYGKAALGPAIAGDTYGTAAGNFGAGVTDGTFVTGMIGSANN